MSLETRITAVVQAIGADIKALQTSGPVGSAAPTLSNLLVYYGYPIAFQGLWSSASVIAAIAGNYSHWIVGDTYQNPAHEEYASTLAIVAGVRALGVIVYGYVPTGLSTSGLTTNQMHTRVDQWATVGVDGIFLDEFGFDYENTRTRQNNITNYVHGKGLPATYNSWTFADTACDTLSEVPYASNDWRYANFQTYNPTNLALPRLPGDGYLFENFCYSHLGAGDVYEVQERAVLINELNVPKGLKIWALGVLPELAPGTINFSLTGSMTNLSDIASYVAATAYIYDYGVVGIGGYSFGASGTAITTPLPNLPVGAELAVSASVSDYVTGIASRTFGSVVVSTKNLLVQTVTIVSTPALSSAPQISDTLTGPPTLLTPVNVDGLEGYLWTPAIYSTGGYYNNTLGWISLATPEYTGASEGNSYSNIYPSHNYISSGAMYNLAGLYAGSNTLSRASGFIFEVAVAFDLTPAGSIGFVGMGTANIYGNIDASEIMTGIGWTTADIANELRIITATGTTLTNPGFARTGPGGLAIGKRFFRAVMSCPTNGSIMTIDLYDETCQFHALKSVAVDISGIGLTVPLGPRAYDCTVGQTSPVSIRIYKFNCVAYPIDQAVSSNVNTSERQVYVQPTMPITQPGVPYLWFQTIGSNMTLWVEDGL